MITKPFSQLSIKDVDEAGGKGASLGEMTQANIPIPPGFVILSSAFERFIEETQIKADIDAINSKLRMNLQEDDYDTFSGFILKLTGKIPTEGDEISYRKFRLKIAEVDKHRISKVKVEKV